MKSISKILVRSSGRDSNEEYDDPLILSAKEVIEYSP